MKSNTRMKSNAMAKGERSGLHVKRETIRCLTAAESRRVIGGMRCTLDSCVGITCNPASVCTITEDPTM